MLPISGRSFAMSRLVREVEAGMSMPGAFVSR